jgi:hypothetical protein
LAPSSQLPRELSDLPAAVQLALRRVVQSPTVSAQGPWQAFPGDAAIYLWLLDHPDLAVHMWRQLGAKCLTITRRPDGCFSWSDGQGSEVHWSALVQTPECRVWFAQGTARPTSFLPSVPLRAVVVLHHYQDASESGKLLIHQQADLYFQTDSKTAALVARLLGPSAPRIAEQCITQLEVFFSALAWYLNSHPNQLRTLAGSIP